MSNVTEEKNRRFKKKGRKGNSKDRVTSEGPKDRTMDTNPRTNDINWYTVSDQLLRDAGSLSFNNPLGNSTRVSELSDFDPSITVTGANNLDMPFPGIMRINYVPTIGYSADKRSSINIAANALYSAVRKDNSGAKNYEPADMMKYLLAISSVYTMYAFMARIYGLSRIYSVTNRYWPKALIRSMNVNPDDVMFNNANLRYAINIIAKKLNTLCAPAKIKYFDRQFWMSMGVWKDAPYDKSQMYVFVPDYVYYYDETVVPARLEPFAIGKDTRLLTVENLVEGANTLLNHLLSSEDIGIISGDLFKAYGMDGSHKLNEVPENFQVYPVYDEVVLSQIQNARAIGNPDLESLRIIELASADDEAGALIQVVGGSNVDTVNPCIEVAALLNLNMDLSEIQPANVMEASRLITMGNNLRANDQTDWVADVCGSEIITTMSIYAYDSQGNLVTVGPSEFTSVLTMSGSTDLALANALTAFAWHPLFRYIANKSNSSVSISADQPFFEVGNYTVVGQTSLRKLHEVALLGLFGVPEFGQF